MSAAKTRCRREKRTWPSVRLGCCCRTWRAGGVRARAAGVELTLRKGIPVGGGLGGGSADAAAVPVGLRRLLGLNGEADDAALMTLGAQIGSDVPFCIRGGAAWCRAGESWWSIWILLATSR